MRRKLTVLLVLWMVVLTFFSAGFALWAVGHFQPKLNCPPPGNNSYGDCLTGLQPAITQCPKDAKTIDVQTVQLNPSTSVTMELRSSKKCSVTWERLSVVGSVASLEEIGMHQDTG